MVAHRLADLAIIQELELEAKLSGHAKEFNYFVTNRKLKRKSGSNFSFFAAIDSSIIKFHALIASLLHWDGKQIQGRSNKSLERKKNYCPSK